LRYVAAVSSGTCNRSPTAGRKPASVHPKTRSPASP
jgi:hypothetical protein